MEHQRQRRAGRMGPNATASTPATSVRAPQYEDETMEYVPAVRTARSAATAPVRRATAPVIRTIDETPPQALSSRRRTVEIADVDYDDHIRDIPVRSVKVRKRRSVLLLIAAVLGVAYAIFISTYWIEMGNALSSPDFAESFGTAIAMSLIMPHAIIVIFAALFNTLGWLFKLRWLGFIAGILYIVAALVMFAYTPYVIVQPILCFVAFAKMKQAKRKS